jgi:hypothetical protein
MARRPTRKHSRRGHERRKIHVIVMEGIRAALKKRGYAVRDEIKPAKKR